MDDIINRTTSALRAGQTLLYPTDTIWGIGCDAANADAINRLYAIKQRDRSKSMLILCSASQIAHGPWSDPSDTRPTTFILAREVWHEALKVRIADNLCAADGSLGIRLPSHTFCQAVLQQLGRPIVSTSANLSGMPSPTCYEEISPELIRRIDYCVPPLPTLLSSETRGSRIVRLNADGSTTLLRP